MIHRILIIFRFSQIHRRGSHSCPAADANKCHTKVVLTKSIFLANFLSWTYLFLYLLLMTGLITWPFWCTRSWSRGLPGPRFILITFTLPDCSMCATTQSLQCISCTVYNDWNWRALLLSSIVNLCLIVMGFACQKIIDYWTLSRNTVMSQPTQVIASLVSTGHLRDLSVLFMQIQNLVTILENLCVTEKTLPLTLCVNELLVLDTQRNPPILSFVFKTNFTGKFLQKKKTKLIAYTSNRRIINPSCNLLAVCWVPCLMGGRGFEDEALGAEVNLAWCAARSWSVYKGERSVLYGVII